VSSTHRTPNLRNQSPNQIHSEISTIQEHNPRSRSNTRDRHSPTRRIKLPSEHTNSSSIHTENEGKMIDINCDL
jgi:hypothetical protein